MTTPAPTREEIEEIAREFGLRLGDEDLETLRQIAHGMSAGAAAVDALPDELPPVRTPRAPGERPPAAENPLGAWMVRSVVEGAGRGPLAGRSVVLKDNIMLAGVPMMNGTRILEGYVPPVDATVVTRILDAGGTIVGKATCESYCLSAGSHTSDTGPVRNPFDPTRTTGGSSSGCAALVADGQVEMAIGGDQGGSIRLPASYCGICGMKPTHGLVPYTGIVSLEPTIDHAGPMTANVSDNALLLEVIAGPDGFDARQIATRVEPYREALERGADGLRIGLLREGFGTPGSQPDVDGAVRAAAATLAKLGAEVREVSVPEHATAGALLVPLYQSAMWMVLGTDGAGAGREDVYVPSFPDHHRRWRERAHELPPTVQVMLVATEVMRRRFGWRAYARAMNHVRRVRAAYDAALQDLDLLLMPTTPTVAPPLPPPDADLRTSLQASFQGIVNTQPFDHTHHPALSVPCGRSGGMPVGMMLVGRAFEESTLYRAARAFEERVDWRSL